MSKKNQNKPVREVRGATSLQRWLPQFLCVALVALVFFTYKATVSSEFLMLNWDDQLYVTQNSLVTSPLSLHSLIQMFTRPVVGTYCGIPQLTWWFDYHFYDIQKVHLAGTPPDTRLAWVASGFHLTNLVFHAANTVLVFLIFLIICERLRFTENNSLFIAFITAFLFGMHPQHVESVAWVTERKDLTYALFFLLAIYAYLKVTHESRRLVLTTMFFILSLLSKGQAVALVPILFLIDYLLGNKTNYKLYGSYLALAIVIGITAIYGQHTQGAVYNPGLSAELFKRLVFIPSYALWGYIRRFVIPVGFSPFYPYPSLQGSIAKDGLMIHIYPVISIAAASLLWYKRHNKLIVFGSLGFLANIILLLQLLPVGSAVMADRYMYIASVFLSFPIAVYISKYWSNSKAAVTAVCVILALTLMSLSINQCDIWKSDNSLWQSTIARQPNNLKAYEQLAEHFQEDCHQPDSAMPYARKAIALHSTNPQIYIYLVSYYLDRQMADSALNYCDMVVNAGMLKTPRDSSLLFQNLGVAYNLLNRDSEAIIDLKKGLRYPLPPNLSIRALSYMGVSYEKRNQIDSAILAFKNAYRIEPHSYIQFNIAAFYLRKGDTTSAREHYNIGLKCADVGSLNPNIVTNLGKQLGIDAAN